MNEKPVSKPAATFMKVSAPLRKNSAPWSEPGAKPPREVFVQWTVRLFRQMACALLLKAMPKLVPVVPALLVPPL